MNTNKFFNCSFKRIHTSLERDIDGERDEPDTMNLSSIEWTWAAWFLHRSRGITWFMQPSCDCQLPCEFEWTELNKWAENFFGHSIIIGILSLYEITPNFFLRAASSSSGSLTVCLYGSTWFSSCTNHVFKNKFLFVNKTAGNCFSHLDPERKIWPSICDIIVLHVREERLESFNEWCICYVDLWK